MTALEIITEAYKSCNRLSPGETLGADEASFAFSRLNLLVDKLSAKREFLFQAVVTSAAQTGNITLGAGSWAAITAGAVIVSASSNGLPLDPITMRQYSETYDVITASAPQVWAQDGLSNVYFVPVPNGQTIKLQTQVGVTTFVDQTTSYTVPPGYKALLTASLAVMLAPTVLGKVPPELENERRACAELLNVNVPAIYDIYSYNHHAGVSRIFQG